LTEINRGLFPNNIGEVADRIGQEKQQYCFVSLTNKTEVFSIQCINSKQMRKWLEQQGATFAQGNGSHLKVFLNGRQSVLPMHGTAELGKGLEAAIKRQLGLK
jgi:mRNA interferase HicA